MWRFPAIHSFIALFIYSFMPSFVRSTFIQSLLQFSFCTSIMLNNFKSKQAMQWRIIVQLKCQMFNVNCIMLLFYIILINWYLAFSLVMIFIKICLFVISILDISEYTYTSMIHQARGGGCCDCKAAIFELTHKRLSELIKQQSCSLDPLTCLSVIICGHYEVTLWRFSATNMKMIFFTDFMYMAAYYRQNLPIAIYSLYRLQPPLSKKKKRKCRGCPPPPSHFYGGRESSMRCR